MDLEHISSSFEDILQEVQTMKMCDDPNILRCYCSFVNADQLWLVTEMMDKGSCLRVMNVARGLGMGDGLSEEWLAYILREVSVMITVCVRITVCVGFNVRVYATIRVNLKLNPNPNISGPNYFNPNPLSLSLFL
jgi:hypothetical protein